MDQIVRSDLTMTGQPRYGTLLHPYYDAEFAPNRMKFELRPH
jgi:hypothetical protein